MRLLATLVPFTSPSWAIASYAALVAQSISADQSGAVVLLPTLITLVMGSNPSEVAYKFSFITSSSWMFVRTTVCLVRIDGVSFEVCAKTLSPMVIDKCFNFSREKGKNYENLNFDRKSIENRKLFVTFSLTFSSVYYVFFTQYIDRFLL